MTSCKIIIIFWFYSLNNLPYLNSFEIFLPQFAMVVCGRVFELDNEGLDKMLIVVSETTITHLPHPHWLIYTLFPPPPLFFSGKDHQLANTSPLNNQTHYYPPPSNKLNHFMTDETNQVLTK